MKYKILLLLAFCAITYLSAQEASVSTMPQTPTPAQTADSGNRPVDFYLGAGVASMIPVGTYSDVTSVGFGNCVELSAPELYRGLGVRMDIAAFYSNWKKEIMTKYQAFTSTLSAEYRFNLADQFYAAPLVGGGVIYHLEEDQYNNKEKNYFDSLALAGISGGFHYQEHLTITMDADYVCFFEQENLGMYPEVKFLILYNF